MKTRWYQNDLISQAREKLKTHRAIIAIAPTGSGKTVTAATIMKSAQDKGVYSMFVVDAIKLVEQTIKTFDAFGLDIGVLQADHTRENPTARVQIASTQTISARLKTGRGLFYNPVNLIIIDEADKQYGARDQLAELFPNAKIIGFTATPFAKKLGNFYQDWIMPVTANQLIDEGYLCDYDMYNPASLTMEGVVAKGKNGDWSETQIENQFDKTVRGDIIDAWQKNAAGKKTLGFAPTVAESRHMRDAFNNAGIPAAHIDGYSTGPTGESERDQIYADHASGKIKVIWSVNVTARGYDDPSVSCLIVARPTKSRSMWIQMCGRLLRVFEGKDRGIIIDHTTNFSRMGWPTNDFEPVLDMGKSGNDTDRVEITDVSDVPRTCPMCGVGQKKFEKKCHQCGHELTQIEITTALEVARDSIVKVARTRSDEEQRFIDTPSLERQEHYMNMVKDAKTTNRKRGYAYYEYKRVYGKFPAPAWNKLAKEVYR